MYSQWIMPFAEKSTMKLHNLGEQEVTVEVGEISVTDTLDWIVKFFELVQV